MKLQGSRHLQAFQAYSQLYYESKLKPIVEKNYKEHLENVPSDEQKTAFAFRTAEIKRLLEAESEDVKREVEEYRKKRMNMSDMAIKIEDTEENDEASQAELTKRMQS